MCGPTSLQKALAKFKNLATGSSVNYDDKKGTSYLSVDEADLPLLDKYLLQVYDNAELTLIMQDLKVYYKDQRNNERSKSLESIQDAYNATNMGRLRKGEGNTTLTTLPMDIDRYTSNLASLSGDANISTYGSLKKLSFGVSDPDVIGGDHPQPCFPGSSTFCNYGFCPDANGGCSGGKHIDPSTGCCTD